MILLGRKILTALVLTFIFHIVCFSAIAEAATVVPIQGKNLGSNALPTHIAYGKLENGTTYVPARILFEEYDAKVSWQGDSQTITIQRCDGAAITMSIGNGFAQMTHNGQSKTLPIGSLPKIDNGQTMVPLRFVTENLLCHVEWHENPARVIITKEYITDSLAGKQYTIHLKTGDFFVKTEETENRLLGRLENISQYYHTAHPDASSITKVEETLNGNYIITVAFNTLDDKSLNRIVGYLNTSQLSSRLTFFKQSQFGSVDYDYCFDEVGVYFPEKEEVFFIDETTGKFHTFGNYKDILKRCLSNQNPDLFNEITEIGFSYCDGNNLLLNYNKKSTFNTKYFILIYLESNKFVDIATKVIPPEDMTDFIRKDYVTPSGSRLQFIKAENGKLYFDYIQYNHLLQPIPHRVEVALI